MSMNMNAAVLASFLVKMGLVNESQIKAAYETIGYRPEDGELLLQALENMGALTPFQSGKVRKGDTSGYVLGGYRILYKIASGSFGRVYRSEDPQTGQVVAVKILRQRWSADDHVIDLFEREGKLGVQLRHPNIVEVLQVNQDRLTEQYYIVMEFVEGGNLREILQIRQKLEPAEALKILDECVQGLAHAYARGVTHRDMKLTNVLISSNGVAKLVDFGLAGFFTRKGLELDGGEKVDRTVDYAGLEKATNVKPGDVRSDIYFLGCILYEMLTGRPPLLMSKDPRVRASKQRFDNVQPIQPEEVKAPPSVFQLVERMMSLDPRVRYQTPSQLLEAVKEARKDVDNPAEAKGPKPIPRVLFVVEKDERLQDTFREKLRELGYKVLIAAEPGRARERLDTQAFDALIMDAGTTGEEGRIVFEQVIREAERNSIKCAGILILNEDQAEWAKEVEELPNSATLIRPLTLKQLRKLLYELVPLTMPNGDRTPSA